MTEDISCYMIVVHFVIYQIKLLYCVHVEVKFF